MPEVKKPDSATVEVEPERIAKTGPAVNGAQQDAPHLPVLHHVGEEQDAHHKAHEDGETAQPGDGLGVHPAAVPGDIHRSDFLLNTFVDIAIYDSRDESILDGAMALCREYENRFSRTLSGSEVYRLNHREDATGTYPLSDDMTDLLATALYYCERSGGAFDITTEPLSSLWNFSGTSPSVPPAEAIEEARKKVDYKKLRLDGTRSTLTFLDPGTSIDLGAIAKGYIADQLKAYLLDSGVESAMINLGGNVLCVGSRPDGTPFTVGLQKPFADRNETFAQVEVSDLSVVASGVYERHFVEDGKNYHHILDPSTGYPYDNGLISVTILSERSVDGDALSTTCFSLGLEKGLELANSLDGIYACFIDEDYDVYYSDGMEDFIIKQ